MLGALGIGKKREAVKFNFNLSVTSIEAFDPTKISKVSDDATYCVCFPFIIAFPPTYFSKQPNVCFFCALDFMEAW